VRERHEQIEGEVRQGNLVPITCNALLTQVDNQIVDLVTRHFRGARACLFHTQHRANGPQ
jgi:hypothetical protein